MGKIEILPFAGSLSECSQQLGLGQGEAVNSMWISYVVGTWAIIHCLPHRLAGSCVGSRTAGTLLALPVWDVGIPSSDSTCCTTMPPVTSFSPFILLVRTVKAADF